MVDMLKTRIGQDILEIGRQEGAAIGRETGREEGREEGREMGLRDSVLEVVRTRFGRVPRLLRRRVQACDDVDQLRELLRRAVQVEDPSELEAPPAA